MKQVFKKMWTLFSELKGALKSLGFFLQHDNAPYKLEQLLYGLILVVLTDIEVILRGTGCPVKMFGWVL